MVLELSGIRDLFFFPLHLYRMWQKHRGKDSSVKKNNVNKVTLEKKKRVKSVKVKTWRVLINSVRRNWLSMCHFLGCVFMMLKHSL